MFRWDISFSTSGSTSEFCLIIYKKYCTSFAVPLLPRSSIPSHIQYLMLVCSKVDFSLISPAFRSKQLQELEVDNSQLLSLSVLLNKVLIVTF